MGRPATSISLASGSIQQATWPDHGQGGFGGVCEPQNRKTKRGNYVRRLPGSAHPQHLPQDQAQIEGCRMNQRALGDVVLAAQMYPPHAAGVVQVSEASF